MEFQRPGRSSSALWRSVKLRARQIAAGVPAGACPPSVHDMGMGNTAKGLWTMERVERLGRYVLLQAEGVFPLGADTLDLSRFATVRRGFRVCDLGCGSGALGLLLLEREEKLELTGVEVEPAAAELARRNLALNGLCGQVLTGDLRDRALLPSGYFDLVVSNPPWFREGGGYSGGPRGVRSAVRWSSSAQPRGGWSKTAGGRHWSIGPNGCQSFLRSCGRYP